MKPFTSHLLAVALIISSIFYILPNLSTDASSYRSESKILKRTAIKQDGYTRYFNKKFVLALEMTDGTEWYLSGSQYNDYWDILQDKNNIGKNIKLFTGHNTSYYYNPVQIEIEGKIIYSPNVSVKWAYAILLLTVIVSIDSGIKLHKRFKNTKSKTANVTS